MLRRRQPKDESQRFEQESFQHQEMVQFADGRMGLGFRTRGDIMNWGSHKYTRSLDLPGARDLAILKTESGRRYAVGSGVVVLLPALDRVTGKFGKTGDSVQAASLNTLAPAGLSDLTIGEAWPIIDEADSVKSVLVEYKVTTPGYEAADQINMPNPFDSAHEHIDRVVEAMDLTAI